jgi:hypothetical protein
MADTRITIRLTRAEIDQALRAKAREIASTRLGLHIPPDVVGEVGMTDGDDEKTTIVSHAIVAWEP